ncbi:aldehyde dehydrogenase family protein [Corynebacterium sp. AOP40-9SA-29]|uniref:aldehyde dehydrogenase family protein n=1 Tax=Corynebacterium sp. AOP40-9SA-29 TaxID=3457677 RepID=UPI0040345309
MTTSPTSLPSLPSSYDELLNAVCADDDRGRPVYDPATEELIGHAPVHGAEVLDDAVATARAAQKEWAQRPDSERRDLLLLAADAVEAVAEPLAELLSREQGKPLNGPNARFEVGGCQAWTRTAATTPLPEEVLVDDGETYATLAYRPVGVVGAIGPWNWPMLISIWQIAPSLRMGNTVVLKPSENTALSVLALCYVLNKVLPAGVLTVVAGDREVGARIPTHPGIDKIMFTGSIATGRKIAESSAGTIKRLTLELGGNDAGIVLEDAFGTNISDPDVVAANDKVAEGIFWGAFINTGQTCAALKRLYVPDSIYDVVCDSLVRVAQKMPMGVGLSEENVLGPLQNQDQFDIVDSLVKEAIASGATVLLGGDPDYSAPGYFYPTTLVSDIDPNNPLVTQEQFGPALPIIGYSSLDEAILEANRLDVGLGSSVWSADRDSARAVASKIEAGTTWINSHGTIDPRVPFGGIKSSGYGLEFGQEGLKHVAVPHVING